MIDGIEVRDVQLFYTNGSPCALPKTHRRNENIINSRKNTAEESFHSGALMGRNLFIDEGWSLISCWINSFFKGF